MIQAAIEKLVDESDRFSMGALYGGVWPLIQKHDAISLHEKKLEKRLGVEYRKLAYGILRHVFLIELVKVPAIETTKFRVRWHEQLRDDQRFCSFDECLDIASDLLIALSSGWLDIESNAEALRLFFNFNLLPYELPIDYDSRPSPADNTIRIHRKGNLIWTATETMLRTLRLRKYLLSKATSPDLAFFKTVLGDKIKTKTYLTDRAQTGPHKTNREKRWETHPDSVQFADRRTCMAIEYVLIQQLCAFEDFPAKARQMLQEQRILPSDLPPFRCPITLDTMSFPAFREALLNPKHGKSDFQVGHLNPLKLDARAGESAGHTADNISWISADGNRIQGVLSLDEVRTLLARIAANYQRRN